ncbi:hypothetical protein TIFTF001_053597 [Ficus carica]|uniref:Uncharacterized protein n=1 Tax=Ficus carica TaxID=3494 RepID=A0AA88JHL0_FICCA|nr:hypothetical protein TIFTF001_053597 [Ficus carica]
MRDETIVEALIRINQMAKMSVRFQADRCNRSGGSKSSNWMAKTSVRFRADGKLRQKN